MEWWSPPSAALSTLRNAAEDGCWGDATGDNRGNGEKKSPCPDFAPGPVPATTLVLFPIPIRSSKPNQKTSSSAPNRSPQRRPSGIMHPFESSLAGMASFFCIFFCRRQQAKRVLILNNHGS